MKTIFNLFIILALSVAGPIVNAQSLRPPTPAEKVALQKAVNALNRITSSFNDNNWEIVDNNFDHGLYVPTGARSQCGIGYTIKLGLRKGSPAYHKVMDPMLAYINSGKLDRDKIESLHSNLEKHSAVTLDIELNSEAIGFGTDSKSNKQLNVAGVSKAFIEAEDNNNPSNNGAYVLAFGDWKNARYDRENDAFRFRFAHPPQTPYIENITIRMRGDEQKIGEIIQNSDWNSLNAVLAK